MWNEPLYDCQECGACCLSQGTSGTAYVYLGKGEAKRMKTLGLSVLQTDGDFHLGTRADAGRCGQGICVAFQGQVGGQCGCSIYQGRPDNCRQFLVGSKECLAARKKAGLSL